jgi:hypothetical protein
MAYYANLHADLLRQRIIQMSSFHSDTSSESNSSSVIYSHEPFNTFGLRILELAQSIWVGASSNETVIERMAGGGFNLIIPLKF